MAAKMSESSALNAVSNAHDLLDNTRFGPFQNDSSRRDDHGEAPQCALFSAYGVINRRQATGPPVGSPEPRAEAKPEVPPVVF